MKIIYDLTSKLQQSNLTVYERLCVNEMYSLRINDLELGLGILNEHSIDVSELDEPCIDFDDCSEYAIIFINR